LLAIYQIVQPFNIPNEKDNKLKINAPHLRNKWSKAKFLKKTLSSGSQIP
jgi:hypothetical protein